VNEANPLVVSGAQSKVVLAPEVVALRVSDPVGGVVVTGGAVVVVTGGAVVVVVVTTTVSLSVLVTLKVTSSTGS
jgi:hypothetical protein